MKLLLLGSTGFIGQQVSAQLRAQGYTLVTPSHREVDFLTLRAEALTPYLYDIDAIINMVGILHHDPARLETIHHHSPLAIARLAKSHAQSQDRPLRFVQLSALGADPDQPIAFVGSKGRGDRDLLALADELFSVAIVRPSLVFGRGGASCELFIKLARLPCLALPDAGRMPIQPAHVEDVVEGLCQLATQHTPARPIINFTGASVVTLAAYLTWMRQQLHQRAAPRIINLPPTLSILIARLAHYPTRGMLSLDSLRLLAAGSVADSDDFVNLLGRQPRGYEDFSYSPDPATLK